DGHLVAVMFIDLDNFKLVNDTLGHAVGDELLCEVARRLDVQLRKGDTKARLGGDEFAVILENLHKAEEAATIVRELAEVLQRPIRLQGRDYVVTTSMGISLYPINGTNAETLLMQADSAMYEAKAAGRNRSEERRVGKEWGARGGPDHEKQNNTERKEGETPGDEEAAAR